MIKSLDDYNVGDVVAFEKSKWERMDPSEFFRTGIVVSKDEEFVYLKGYKKHEIDYEGGFFLTSIMSVKETSEYLLKLALKPLSEEEEEDLYNCSYCGLEGHNRRTCPKLSDAKKGETSMQDTYEYGSAIKYEDIKQGTLIRVTKRSGAGTVSDAFNYGVYEVVNWPTDGVVFTKVISIQGSSAAEINLHKERVGVFGKNWTFADSEWNFFEAVEVNRAAPKERDIWSLVEVVLPVSRLTLLYGPPGTGKTTAGNFLGEPKEVYNLTLTEETPAAELRGHFIPKGSEFVWMDGPALTAFKRGGRLVLNEIDKASGDALTFCHALLDDPGIARITLPYKDEAGNTVTISPHEDFNVVATMNGEPEDLPEALRDRFAVRIHVDKVHPAAIQALPVDLQKIASKGISKDGDRSVSIRGWNAFVQLREIIGEVDAARAVFGHRADTILNTIKIDGLKTK